MRCGGSRGIDTHLFLCESFYLVCAHRMLDFLTLNSAITAPDRDRDEIEIEGEGGENVRARARACV